MSRKKQRRVLRGAKLAAVVGIPIPLTNFLKVQPNLQAIWTFSELSGNLINVAPATLGSLDGVPSGPTQGAAGPGGDPELFNAYSYDNDDIVTVANDATLANMGDQTWAFLINFASEGEANQGRILSWGNGVNHLRVQLTKKYRFSVDYNTTDAEAVSEDNAWIVDTWNWVIAGHDATTKRNLLFLGINGKLNALTLVTDTVGVGTLQNPGQDLELGNAAALSATIDGLIAYSFVFNVAPDAIVPTLAEVVRLSGV